MVMRPGLSDSICKRHGRLGTIRCFSRAPDLPTIRLMPLFPTLPRPPDSVAVSNGDLNAVIVDTSASLIVVLDPRGGVVRFNHACEEASGYAFDEVRGRVFWEFLLEGAEAAIVKRIFGQLLAGKFPRS